MLDVIKLNALVAWDWLRPKLKWVGLALIATLTLGAAARRRQRYKPQPMSERDASALAEAVRPKMLKRVEEAEREAREHKNFAEQRLRDAAAERARVEMMSEADLMKASDAYARKVRARRGKGMLALLVFLALPSASRAQEAMPFQLRDPSTGEAGFFIPADVWRSALADFAELEQLQAALPRFRQALAARELEADELRRSVAFEQGMSELATAKLEAANERLERAGRWYRSPRFLVPLGVALGAAGVLVPALVMR